MKLVIFTPCQNEEATLSELFKRMPKKIEGIDSIELLMVDDGSTDKSVAIARNLGVKVIENKRKKKVAYTHMKGIETVLDMGADIAVSIDADLQFSPEFIPTMVEPIVSGRADFVSANRFENPETGKTVKPDNMPVAKYFGNRVGAWLVSTITGEKYPDVTCGFRAYSKEALLNLNINGKFTYTQESFLVLASKKMNIEFVPVEVKYFKGRKSRVVVSILQYILQSGISIMSSFRDYAPLKFFGLLGLVPFVTGFVAAIFVLIHWIRTGSFTPYKYLGFASIYILSVSFVIWLLGFLADMQDRLLHNQEKILYEIKSLKYGKSKK
ncbi:glycosyltransferase family 2 protein [Candidatus Dojkabacteria bacterium]|nr:glycosyltransferase family 2 protein [Candidatus Dojkabacteria bacterium]